MKTPWLVIGSSPHAIEATEAARADHDALTTMTCNRGIVIEPTPDYYFLTDRKACEMWNAHARHAQNNGSTLVTLRRSETALKKRGVEWFPVIVENGPPYEPFALSGLWCMEFAALQGAETVVLSGLDGWSKDGSKMDYFEPTWGRVKHVTNWSDDIIQPRCQLLADKYPAVSWVQYGRPEFTVEADNWQVL